MAIDLEKYKLKDNLDKYKLAPTQPQIAPETPMQPEPAQGTNFLKRLKLSFGGKEAEAERARIEQEAGLKGKFDIGDVADVAGKSLPFIGGTLGGMAGSVLPGIGTALGAGAGAGGGEIAKQAIGKVLGVREDMPIGEEGAAIAKEGIGTFAAGKVGGWLLGKIPRLVSVITGQSDDIVKQAFRNPKAANAAINAGDDTLREMVRQGAEKSIQMKTAFLQGHSQAFQKLAGQYSGKIADKNEVMNSFYQTLKDHGVKVTQKGALDFRISNIATNPGEIAKIKGAQAALRQWDDWSVAGVNRLKQLMGGFRKFEGIGGATSKSPSLGQFYNALNVKIKTTLPKHLSKQYSDMNLKFEKTIDLYDDMVDAFNRGDPFSKLANVFSKNKDSLRQVVEFFEKQSSGKIPIFPTIAGRELAKEGEQALFNPRTYLDFLFAPSTQGKAITTVGRIVKPLRVIPKAPTIGAASEGIQRSIRSLFNP